MLYHLFRFLDEHYPHFPGLGVFQYLTFRAMLAAVLSLIISVYGGSWIIKVLKAKLIGEKIRELGPESHKSKAGTPTMGGIIILAATLLPVLLWANLGNLYIWLAVLGMLSMGLVGWMDDYIKVFRKDKRGLHGRFKIYGQVLLGLIVGLVMVLHSDFAPGGSAMATQTNVPFLKDHVFQYGNLMFWTQTAPEWGSRLIFIVMAVFIVTAVSNGVNITDGLDGLAAGTTAIVAVTLGIFAYVTGNAVFAKYLNIMFLPKSGELFIFCAALIGSCLGFLWYNTYPAQVFMGDTGSLALGGAVGVLALLVKVELLLPLICAVYFVENLSVILQVGYFKYTKKKYGEGRRIFRMAPLHHHYELGGLHESKIVIRFWILTALLEILVISTLKLR